MKMLHNMAFFQLISIMQNAIRRMPLYFTVFIGSSILHAITWFLVVETNQRLYDSIELYSTNEISFQAVFLSILAIAAVQITKHILNGVSNYIPILIKSNLKQDMTHRFHERVSTFDAISFENNDFLDRIEKANRGKDEIAWNIITLIFVVTFYMPYLFLITIYLLRIRPMLVLAILALFIPISFAQLLRENITYSSEKKQGPLRRENNYYRRCITDRENFKETRMLGAVPYFLRLFDNSLKEIHKLQIRAERKATFIILCLQILEFFAYLGMLIILVNSTLNGAITVGVLAAVFQGVNDIFKLLAELVFSQLGGMVQDLGYIKNFTSFMYETKNMEGNIDSTSTSSNYAMASDDISMVDVSFKYPGSDFFALQNINLSIKSGEVIALVGENGSGKTTLVKLLSGLYKPTTGQVYRGSVSIQEISKEKLFCNTSAVFQNYQKYLMTLEENIIISDTEKCSERDYVRQLCLRTGVIGNEEDDSMQLDTLLSKEFGGTDISGGQWQRTAFARGLYRDSKLIILDEPTASIDPIEESNIYRNFIHFTAGKTVFLVTHRLGSVKIADRILVLSKGQIVGDGTHDQLIENNETYRTLYNAQEKWYHQPEEQPVLI